MTSGFKFAIDRGGTFTDVWCKCPDGEIVVKKLLSVEKNYSDAPCEGIRRILQQKTGIDYPSNTALDASNIEWIRMGTTVATNALLERKGERMVLLITKGFKDLLYIGNQSRPRIFDLEIIMPDLLYEEVLEVDERVVLNQDKCVLNNNFPIEIASTGEKVEIWKKPNLENIEKDLKLIFDRGITSIAVAFMHSYIYPNHELMIEKMATKIGFSHISLSSKIMSMARIVPRGFTTCADAYLSPCIKEYLKKFFSGFNNLEESKVLLMQSDGGLSAANNFIGSRAVLSGPAGGVIGFAKTTYEECNRQPVIGFDMGGTSTDVSRYAGEYTHTYESTTAGIIIQAPQLDINTVAAGGGSRLFFASGMFVVGPESVGANPGPVCYRKGKDLSVTDANLILGRILPEYFPKIFGPQKDEGLDVDATMIAFQKLTDEVNTFAKLNKWSEKSVQEVAYGFIKVANEAMCRPIRAITQARGYNTATHVLACFGGAGGQHACAIAKSLGIKRVFIHKFSCILSAYGMALADVVTEIQEPCSLELSKDYFDLVQQRIDFLSKKCQETLMQQGFNIANILIEPYLHLRYEGTDCALMCTITKPNIKTLNSQDFLDSFLNRYEQEFGFTMANRKVLIDNIRIRAIGKHEVDLEEVIQRTDKPPTHDLLSNVFFEEGVLETKIYNLSKLLAGHQIFGPAIIIDQNSTILVEPGCTGSITSNGNISIEISEGKSSAIGLDLDPIQLSIFSHRFMSTAEQMGRVLQRTSISTNIKERLDFSCAMFGPDGGLVANAPHIPVHLGAMQEAVQYQMKMLGDKILPGDVLLSNHPCAGGSHLPDLTVITPVFYKSHSRPVFFVASRGHHADIGGITPGSMPPHSKSIFEEGAVFTSFFLVKAGIFQEELVTEVLKSPGKYVGCSGTRNLQDNLSDLKAQVAANKKGIGLIQDLIDEYGLNVVQAYMNHIQSAASLAVKSMLKEIAEKLKEVNGSKQLYAEDYMDDGSRIALSIIIDPTEGTAIFDFTGTTHEVYGNLNAPRAVTLSAIIYCLRCMVGRDVPLNQGCLEPITVVIPSGSFLSASETAAVVGGNVLTSQRLVDVVFKAFNVCAASQGCMNNVTIGDESVGFYETVAGGAGAGPCWHGRSGVHTHMTNTRITDPEILEKRYPVVVQKFSLNSGSGGEGKFKGGDGVIRELLFRKEITLSVLSERRVHAPYGMNGGIEGKRGMNLLKTGGKWINLGGKASIKTQPGDVFHLETPGGGGYGSPGSLLESAESNHLIKEAKSKVEKERGSIFDYTKLQESA